MAGSPLADGKQFIASLLVNRSLELGLFTNSTLTGITNFAGLTEPTGGGYARKTLIFTDWTVTAGVATCTAVKSFAPVTTNYTGIVRGYFIRSATSPYEVIAINMDANLGSGVQFNVGSSYDITPQINVP